MNYLQNLIASLVARFSTATVDGILKAHIKTAAALESLEQRLLKSASTKEAEATKLKAEAAAADAEAVKAHEAATRLRALVSGS